LKQYPIVGKGQRIVMKDQQAIVKGQLGKRKGHMASVEEDGMPHSMRDGMEVDYEFLQDTGTHQAPVMTAPNISNVLLEERGVFSSGERSPVCNLGVFEVTETVDTTRLAVVSENHEHVEVEGDREGHALEVEDEEWGWSPLFCLFRDFPEFRPPNFPPRPWKHTEEEFDVIHKFLKRRKTHRTETMCPGIVLALKATWHFHFGNGSSIIEHYPKLVEKLAYVNQDREFVHNLLRMQHLMTDKQGHLTRYGRLLFLEFPGSFPPWEKPPPLTLEDDVSSLKATFTSHEHQEVFTRVLDSLILITRFAMEHLASDVQMDMWHLAQNYGKELAMSHWKHHCFHMEQICTGFTLDYITEGEDCLPYL